MRIHIFHKLFHKTGIVVYVVENNSKLLEYICKGSTWSFPLLCARTMGCESLCQRKQRSQIFSCCPSLFYVTVERFLLCDHLFKQCRHLTSVRCDPSNLIFLLKAININIKKLEKVIGLIILKKHYILVYSTGTMAAPIKICYFQF